MSKKRKKKSPLRNEFTDALNVEMAERKIIERTQKETGNRKQETVENAAVGVAAVSLDKVSVEKPATEKISNEKVPLEKIPVEKDEQDEKITPPTAPQIKKPRKMSHPEKFGGIISVVMLVYAFVNMDKPLFFLALSLFAHFLGYSIAAVFGKYADAVQNAIHSFSIVIFFGAIMFLFTD